jgi:hypothetical protein
MALRKAARILEVSSNLHLFKQPLGDFAVEDVKQVVNGYWCNKAVGFPNNKQWPGG